MKRHQFSDETLMAFADGALDAETARLVQAATADDPDIAARVAVFSQTRDLLREVGRERPLAPVSPALVVRAQDALQAERYGAATPGKVVDLASRGTGGLPFRAMAVAATLALAVGVAGGALVSRVVTDGDMGGPRLAMLDAPAIAQALEKVPSGQRAAIDGGEISIVASFRNADDEFCREFEYMRSASGTVVSVACHGDTGWQPRFALAVPGSTGGDYSPASSLDVLDLYLDGVGAGAPLSLADEAAALSALPR